MGTKCLLCVSYCGKVQERYKDKRKRLSAFQGLQKRHAKGISKLKYNNICNYQQTSTSKITREFRSGEDHILLEKKRKTEENFHRRYNVSRNSAG